MIFILLLLSTDPIAFKEVKNSTGLVWFLFLWGFFKVFLGFGVFFLYVPFLAIAIAVTRIVFKCKKENQCLSSFCSAPNISIYGQYILQQTTEKEDQSSAKPGGSYR